MRKFCTSCQSLKLEEGGVYVKTRVTRWQCKGCSLKINHSPYANSETRKRYEEERLEGARNEA